MWWTMRPPTKPKSRSRKRRVQLSCLVLNKSKIVSRWSQNPLKKSNPPKSLTNPRSMRGPSVATLLILGWLTSIGLCVFVRTPQNYETFPVLTVVNSTYQLTNALSSGTRALYVYIEPGHALVHRNLWPFKSIQATFHFVTPKTKGPFALVFYDMQEAGVQDSPFVTVTSLSMTAQ